MKIHIHVYNHYPQDDTVKLLSEINNKLNLVLMKETEAAAKLAQIQATVEKVSAEVTAKLEELRLAIEAQGDVSPEVEAALTALETAVTGVDNLIPDATPPPTE